MTAERIAEARRLITRVVRKWPAGDTSTRELREALALLSHGITDDRDDVSTIVESDEAAP